MTPTVAAPTAPVFRVFNEEPGSDFTGMVPAYFSCVGLRKDSGGVAVAFKFLNEITLRSENLSDVIKTGRLSCVKYDKGQIDSFYILDNVVRQLAEIGINEAILSPGGDEYSPKGSFSVHSLTVETYNKMARRCTLTLEP